MWHLSVTKTQLNRCDRMLRISWSQSVQSGAGPGRAHAAGAHHGQLKVAVEEAEQRARERGGQRGRRLAEQVLPRAQVLAQPRVQLPRNVLRRAALPGEQIPC